jgi:hypothetical protein
MSPVRDAATLRPECPWCPASHPIRLTSRRRFTIVAYKCPEARRAVFYIEPKGEYAPTLEDHP